MTIDEVAQAIGKDRLQLLEIWTFKGGPQNQDLKWKCVIYVTTDGLMHIGVADDPTSAAVQAFEKIESLKTQDEQPAEKPTSSGGIFD